jgi:tetratricopeptide (TPR) repeat protein
LCRSIDFLLRTFAQESSHGGSAKQDAPKVIETGDMKLAMKASKAEASGNYDEALKLYGDAIELKGRFTPFVYQNRGMLYLHRAKAAQDRQSRIADLQRAIADFQTSIRLGAASKDELNHGLEKVATRTNLEEATKLLAPGNSSDKVGCNPNSQTSESPTADSTKPEAITLNKHIGSEEH